MRTFMLTVAALSIFGTAAIAQNEPAQSGPANAAIKSMDQNNSSMPVAGANSFTKSQAKSHIEAKGYTNVSSLRQDKNGVWRGVGTKNGQAGPVSVDYQGNVN